MSKKAPITAIDERALRTRNNIARAVVSLGAEKPVDKLTVGEICRQAGIARSTFYGHFPSLGDYLEISYANMLANCALRGGQEPQGAGKVLAVHLILQHIYNSRRYALSVEGSRQRPRMLAAGEKRLRVIVDQNLRLLMSHLTETERETTATFIAGGFISLLRSWTANGLNEQPENVALRFENTVNALLSGLQPVVR